MDEDRKNVLLIATTNAGKLVEMNALISAFQNPPVQLLSAAELKLGLNVVEDGQTYEENARKKAHAYSQASFMLTLADDSGLEVELLGGRPGIHSARYRGKPAAADADAAPVSDAARRTYLLAELAQYPRPWNARFCCVAALALPDGSIYTSRGECRGEIIPEERGANGFGYDPIFLIHHPDYSGRTMAELNLPEKNEISHRALAVRGLFPVLERLLS